MGIRQSELETVSNCSRNYNTDCIALVLYSRDQRVLGSCWGKRSIKVWIFTAIKVPCLTLLRRIAFQYALNEGKSVILVPGGMKEMQYSVSTKDEIVIYKSHKGFVKMAITHGIDLVPMFSFGETKVFSFQLAK